ncbi:hypothetical protein Nekkels1_64 [Cellulophaga phage Nekkels_1]|uniref:Uncharacterized protein n=1 Tax=Cellulophaga phage Nekkels_1 TaxID=2745692 RepID=A0A8E4XXR3_9CAUD|nr:hypothetical protein M1M31_gp64 [Cellulophaga phage Nekkels_1]QQO97068.1 hypothetical protein Nekkels1_64 [Cellulophaga phage Nekkels_1]
MKKIDEAYEEMMIPSNFVKGFADMEHFREWARQGIINDCKATLKVFEKHEMYEYCKVLQDVIDDKVDLMLSGLGFDV